MNNLICDVNQVTSSVMIAGFICPKYFNKRHPADVNSDLVREMLREHRNHMHKGRER